MCASERTTLYLFSSPGKDDLSDYHVFHDNPVVMPADDAYLQVRGKKTQLVEGVAWILRKGQEKEKLATGMPIACKI